MKASSFHTIVHALKAHNVRYIVVGGLAVIAHGYLRATRDADIVLELVPDNIESAFRALNQIGYRPTVPITSKQFSNADLRKIWHTEKNMQVLQFWSDSYPDTKLDVFVQHPFDFNTEWESAKSEHTGDQNTLVRFASIPTLISMKQSANRLKDQIDIEFLKKIQQATQK
ncbi:MAG: hypothetical protein ACPGN3_01000 [Opitutales bacterium]